MSSNQSSSTSLYNPELEANSLAILLRYGSEIWGEFHLIDRQEYSPAHRVLFDHIKIQLDSTPPGSVDPLILSDRIRAAGVTALEGGFNPADYLQGLKDARYVEKDQAPFYAKELKRLRVRRDLIVNLDNTKQQLIKDSGASFEDMTGLVEKGLTSVTTDYHKTDTEEVMGDGLIRLVEERALNPVKPEEMLYMGPFDSINRTIGSVLGKGSLTTIVARTGGGKSSLSFFWCTYVAEKYGVPLLWLDAAEMTVEQLQMRAVCCLSNGRVPLWAVRSGEWDKNPTWRKIVRNEVWPRVKKITMTYKNVGSMSPKEKIAFIRRYYYNKVGRDNFLIIGDDYIKGVEAMSSKTAEWQAAGYYIGEVKSLITDEIQAGYWTSLQGNRSSIVQGKKLSEIVDSGESGASISDRIIQQATTAFLLRHKIPEEIAAEKELFGNVVLKKAKLREGYGRDYDKIARPIRLSNGQYVENYWHLHSSSFFYQDRGLHSEALEILGKSPVDLTKSKDGATPPTTGL